MPTEHAGMDAGHMSGRDPELLSSSLPRYRTARGTREATRTGGPFPTTPASTALGRASSGPRLEQLNASIHQGHVDDLLLCLRRGAGDEAVQEVDAHLERGVSLERVYLDLLGPTARRLGELWDEDACDYFEVTLQVGRIQRMVRLLASRFRPSAGIEGPGGRIRRLYLASPDREQHTLGMALVAEFFVRAGWHVTMGSPLDTKRTAHEVQSGRFDLMGVSLSRSEVQDEVAEVVDAVRSATLDSPVPVVLGGPVAGNRQEMVRTIGADAWAEDGIEALRMARNLCGCVMAGGGH